MKKEDLRELYRNRRKQLSETDRSIATAQIFDRYLKNFSPLANENIHIFLPIQRLHEIDTFVWIQYFLKNHIHVYVPKVVDDEMISVPYTKDMVLKKNRWGIPEPTTNKGVVVGFNQVLTPLLYADHRGNRIGYGKGFYDRFFKKLNTDALKIGLNFFKPDETIEDPDDNDVALDYLIFPTGFETF